jgi:tRNA nucleotidyltransferase (CCA-adding enzyme)
VVGAVSNDIALRWAALLHDVGKVSTFTQDENGRGHFYGHAQESARMADEILRRLKAPTALREQVVLLISQHMTILEPDKKILRRRLGAWGEETVRYLLALQNADFYNKGVQEEGSLASAEDCLNEILAEAPCLTVKDLAITGQDILSLGIAPGPQIGECMRHLLQQVQNELLPNEKKVLMQAADAYFGGNV